MWPSKTVREIVLGLLAYSRNNRHAVEEQLQELESFIGVLLSCDDSRFFSFLDEMHWGSLAISPQNWPTRGHIARTDILAALILLLNSAVNTKGVKFSPRSKTWAVIWRMLVALPRRRIIYLTKAFCMAGVLFAKWTSRTCCVFNRSMKDYIAALSD